jgi:protein phosphatase
MDRFHPPPTAADPKMPLVVVTGSASESGPCERNEDFCGVVTPEGPELDTKGVLLAVADGVGGVRGGRDASEYTVRGLLADYYATSDTWPVPQALDRVLNANNQWLLGRAAAHRELSGMATTLSALVLRGQRYYIAHVGDSRIYLMRGERFKRLTSDHVWDREDMRHVLTRAVGLSPHLVMDHADDALEQDDIFLLASDGVWEPLGDKGMHEILLLHRDPARAAKALVEKALARGGKDNATAVVARIDKLPAGELLDTLAEGTRLAPPPRLAPAQWLDRFEVVELLHQSRATLLYKVRDREKGTLAVLKTLQPALASDADQCAALLGEEWLASRVMSHYFPQVLPLAAGERSCLYYVMSYHEGSTLRQRLDHGEHFTVSAVVQIGIRLLKGLSALHRLNIIHRDIKPDNVHLGSDEKLRILDLGVALNHGAIHQANGGAPGTPSFMAPELFAGRPADLRADLYAAGVTLYHLLTRKYPYGEIEPFQRPRFGDPLPPTRYRPETPKWLENLLLKSVAADPKLRFETAEEFLVALERGERSAVLPPPRTPLVAYVQRVPWRSVAAISLVLNLLLLYILLVR